MAALATGFCLDPSLTVMFCWLAFFVVLLPEVVLAHVGYYGLSGGALAAAYWCTTFALQRWDPDLRSAEGSWLRSARFWEHLAAYFPGRLVAEATYDTGLHLFIVHPHGLWGCGTWSNLIPVREGIKLPRRRVCTLEMNFKMPVLRDLLFSLGLIGSSAKSIRKTLKAGINVMLVVGGGSEALLTKPGTMELVLKKRRGFVKLAIEAGASLVPVLNFGETAAYTPAGASRFWDQLNGLLSRSLGMTLPVLSGRLGTFLPFQVPQHTVMGQPVDVQQESNPPDELIEKVHAQYCAALRALYDRHKDTFDKDRLQEMRFVG